MCNYIGPADYGTTNMFVKQTVARARDAHEGRRGTMPYQQVILVLADRIEALEKPLHGAPALLEALRLTVAALEGKPCRQQALDDARAAIAKATS